METIKTATGKIFSCDYLSITRNPDQIYIRIVGRSLPEVAAIFGDPTETVQLWHEDQYLAQYTRLVFLSIEDGAIKVCLAKE